MAKKSKRNRAKPQKISQKEVTILLVAAAVFSALIIFSFFDANPTGLVSGHFNVTVASTTSCVVIQNASLTGSVALSSNTSTGSGGTKLVLENNGNGNVSVNFSSNVSVSGLFTGAVSGGSFQWNFSDHESNSVNVTNTPAGLSFTNFREINTSSTTNQVPQLDYNDSRDTLQVGFNVKVPSDAQSGKHSAKFTITCA
tara:strand:- start:2917 stop:3510 length:594 start_codon:yes stop_codon:yes gene_type:complete